jgi:hypothetical protein
MRVAYLLQYTSNIKLMSVSGDAPQIKKMNILNSIFQFYNFNFVTSILEFVTAHKR